MLQQIARTVIRRASRNGTRSSSHHAVSDFKPAHMDELPVPQGSWQKSYDEKQKSYNMQLVAGILLFTGSVSYCVFSDLMFFNAFPPEPKKE